MGAIHRKAARPYVSEEPRLDVLKLAKPSIAVYRADGRRVMLGVEQVRILNTAGRMARLIQRKDGAVTRAYMKAEPNEVGKRITAAKEYMQVGASTWIHTRNRWMMGKNNAV